MLSAIHPPAAAATFKPIGRAKRYWLPQGFPDHYCEYSFARTGDVFLSLTIYNH
jgi:hypothetical protein